MVGVDALEAGIYLWVSELQLLQRVLDVRGDVLKSFFEEPVSISVGEPILDSQVAGSVGTMAHGSSRFIQSTGCWSR